MGSCRVLWGFIEFSYYDARSWRVWPYALDLGCRWLLYLITLAYSSFADPLLYENVMQAEKLRFRDGTVILKRSKPIYCAVKKWSLTALKTSESGKSGTKILNHLPHSSPLLLTYFLFQCVKLLKLFCWKVGSLPSQVQYITTFHRPLTFLSTVHWMPITIHKHCIFSTRTPWGTTLEKLSTERAVDAFGPKAAILEVRPSKAKRFCRRVLCGSTCIIQDPSHQKVDNCIPKKMGDTVAEESLLESCGNG